ncbi:MAG TPA: hypothetical protein VHQ21_17135, partial [Rhodanobacteraceae bacterium]|nr:hypothetical protein [Rhodanobacteraceae bacterium]
MLVEEQRVLVSANLPRRRKQPVGNLGSSEVLQTQRSVTAFDRGNRLSRCALADQRFGHVRSALNLFEAVQRMGFHAGEK